MARGKINVPGFSDVKGKPYNVLVEKNTYKVRCLKINEKLDKEKNRLSIMFQFMITGLEKGTLNDELHQKKVTFFVGFPSDDEDSENMNKWREGSANTIKMLTLALTGRTKVGGSGFNPDDLVDQECFLKLDVQPGKKNPAGGTFPDSQVIRDAFPCTDSSDDEDDDED